MEIKRKYIIDEHNRAVAVQLDMKTFERIEEMLENYGPSAVNAGRREGR